MSKIIARHREIKTLDRLFRSGKPEFLAVYGRRRVGKTFLIREFFKDKGIFFHLTGIKDAPVRKQLKNFTQECKRIFGELSPSLTNWQDAFFFLSEIIEKRQGKERIILFFDELPWLATHRSGFLQDLDHFWNRHASNDSRVLLIVCGSAAAWMIRKVVHDKGGLHGRLSGSMRLMPFDLFETEQFLKSQGVELERRQIIDIYMALGGVPKYLSYVERGLSSSQVINQICFRGVLASEFDELYSSLFQNYEQYIAVVKALASRNQGLTKIDIASLAKITPGGGMNDLLENLEQSGFILSVPNLQKGKNIRYRLIDEYSLFYLRWIEPAKMLNIGGVDTNFWLNAEGSAESKAWAGFAFEGICMQHIGAIKKALGISGVQTQTSGWFYRPEKGSLEKGTQIDLVIKRADHCTHLCEIKFSQDEFTISKAYEQELRYKKAIFLEKTKTKDTIFFTFITLYGVNKASGYFGIVDSELTMDDLFGSLA